MQETQENPYRSPENEAAPLAEETGAGLSETALFYLKGTHGWLRFLGVMGFIGCGFLVLTGLAVMIFSNKAAGFNFSEISDATGIFGNLAGSLAGYVGVIYLAIAVLYFFPAKYCWNFGTKILNFLTSGAQQDLEGALKNNKSLFKFYGILTIVGLAMIPLMIIIAVIAVVASGSFF